jgi:hypothetical protein
MDKSELAYVVYVKVWEDTEKVRHDIEQKLNQICGLAFIEVTVQDASGD